MPSLIYLANMRLPTEKAHGLQITQMCEAFSQAGHQVTLVVPDRNIQQRHQGIDSWTFYGVSKVFKIVRLWTMDLGVTRILYRFQAATFFLTLLIWLARQPRDAVIYSRDAFLLWLVGLLYPRRTVVFEAHTASATRFGRSVMRRVLRHATLALAVTRHLADELESLSGAPVAVEHDGIRMARFDSVPGRAEARGKLDLPADAFIASYVGQLTTMGMDKGLGTVITAFGECASRDKDWAGHLLIVGGEASAIAALRAQWESLGLPPQALHSPGQVAASEVPLYLAAGDACLMPQPWTQFFAYYTSPLKLFEYMAAARPILASDLPSFREVLAEGDNALFFPPSDAGALAGILLKISADEKLRDRMGKKNRADVEHYTWLARARRIMERLAARQPEPPRDKPQASPARSDRR